MDDSQTTITETEEVEGEEKQSTKTFTQSDFDKHIAREKARIEEKYGDYETNKARLDELEKSIKDKAMAEMSELEKATATITDLNTKIEVLANSNLSLNKDIVRSKVLSSQDFNILPDVYKNAIISSDNEEEVLDSAKAILEQYNKDFGGVSRDSVPEPGANQQTLKSVSGINPVEKTAMSFKDKIKQRTGQWNNRPI